MSPEGHRLEQNNEGIKFQWRVASSEPFRPLSPWPYNASDYSQKYLNQSQFFAWFTEKEAWTPTMWDYTC